MEDKSRKIVFIIKKQSFLVNTIIDKLTESDYNVIIAETTVSDLKQKLTLTDQVIFYLGDFISEINDVMVYLRDLCIEEEKYLYLIGSKVEIDEAKKAFSSDVVTHAFERPINVKDLIGTISDIRNESERRKSILVVDDDATFLRAVHSWLSDTYRVTMVSSGMNAITYLAKHTPDLILLDYEMPVASGPQILEMIRNEATTSNTPVIFLTGKGDKESVVKVLALKPDGYLLKTMKPSEIHKAVDDFFEGRKGKFI